MISEKIIEHAPNVALLIEMGILTKEEVREFLELKTKEKKQYGEVEVDGKKYTIRLDSLL